MKISVIGAGNVGGATALRLSLLNLGEIMLIDPAGELAKAKAFDLNDARFVSGKKYSAGQKLKFKVIDELAGVDTYNAYIDNRWILLRYDAKSDTLVYTIDDSRLESGKNYELRIEVRDKKGNLATFNGNFYY